MNEISTFRDLFRHDDWSRDRLFDAAGTLSDGQLDRTFEMGLKTLRTTLIHIHEAMYWWMGICRGEEDLPEPAQNESMADLRRRWHETVRERDAILAARDDQSISAPVTYTDRLGNPRACAVGDILMHVYNHGVYHRAQAVNMLRQLGAQPPKIDFMFMHFEDLLPTSPAISLAVVRRYYQFCDWVRPRVFDVVAQLDDAKLDWKFEMGMGTIRATLAHTVDAERWWLGNWTGKPIGAFPKPDPTLSMQKLSEQFSETAAKRNDFLKTLSDTDLTRAVTAKPAPDRTLTFPLGVTLLQIPSHTTHHRAQLVNMLRHVGAPPLKVDFIGMTRE